jgi:hypothetical protein
MGETLQSAYDRWVAAHPGAANDCPCRHGSASHYFTTRRYCKRPDGAVEEVQKRHPKADSQVCEREKAWRNYISIRDRKNYRVADKVAEKEQ